LEYSGYSKGDIIIGNDVWIGSGVKILSGVTIGDGCVIGANALVCKNVPSYSVCGGVPARLIKNRFSDEIIKKLEFIKWWDWSETDIIKIIPILQGNDFTVLFEYYQRNICTENTTPRPPQKKS
jgi:hypothetical protein